MTAQDATKAHKNAKARRDKKKADGTTGEDVKVRRERGSVVSAPKRSMPERIRRYFQGVAAENRRVSWPGKPEVIAGTVTTLFILVVFSVYLGGIDYVFKVITARLGL